MPYTYRVQWAGSDVGCGCGQRLASGMLERFLVNLILWRRWATWEEELRMELYIYVLWRVGGMMVPLSCVFEWYYQGTYLLASILGVTPHVLCPLWPLHTPHANVPHVQAFSSLSQGHAS